MKLDIYGGLDTDQSTHQPEGSAVDTGAHHLAAAENSQETRTENAPPPEVSQQANNSGGQTAGSFNPFANTSAAPKQSTPEPQPTDQAQPLPVYSTEPIDFELYTPPVEDIPDGFSAPDEPSFSNDFDGIGEDEFEPVGRPEPTEAHRVIAKVIVATVDQTLIKVLCNVLNMDAESWRNESSELADIVASLLDDGMNARELGNHYRVEAIAYLLADKQVEFDPREKPMQAILIGSLLVHGIPVGMEIFSRFTSGEHWKTGESKSEPKRAPLRVMEEPEDVDFEDVNE